MATPAALQVNLNIEDYRAYNGVRYKRIRATIPMELLESGATKGVWERRGNVLLLYPKA